MKTALSVRPAENDSYDILRDTSTNVLDQLPLLMVHKDIAFAVTKIKGKSIEEHIADLIKVDNECFADTRNDLTIYVKRRLEEVEE